MTPTLSRDRRIHQKLTQDFMPDALEVINESHLHATHSGSPQTGESHYQIRIHAETLTNLPLKDSHRRIYQALASEFDTGLHALSIKIL